MAESPISYSLPARMQCSQDAELHDRLHYLVPALLHRPQHCSAQPGARSARRQASGPVRPVEQQLQRQEAWLGDGAIRHPLPAVALFWLQVGGGGALRRQRSRPSKVCRGGESWRLGSAGASGRAALCVLCTHAGWSCLWRVGAHEDGDVMCPRVQHRVHSILKVCRLQPEARLLQYLRWGSGGWGGVRMFESACRAAAVPRAGAARREGRALASRLAHSSNDSPYSRCPPGSAQVPAPADPLLRRRGARGVRSGGGAQAACLLPVWAAVLQLQQFTSKRTPLSNEDVTTRVEY